jgi:hypothetical protein
MSDPERKELRQRILRAIYDLADGNPAQFVYWRDEAPSCSNETQPRASPRVGRWHALPPTLYELTTPRRSFLPPRWVRSRRSNWSWSSATRLASVLPSRGIFGSSLRSFGN